GNFQTVADLLLTSTQEIAKRCKSSPLDVKRIVDAVLDSIPAPELTGLDRLSLVNDEKFTTGDDILDDALGGGIRTGMIWEIVGESAAGKTQFALQLSLFVQAPAHLGGLAASTCYLTTSSKLSTARLLQMSRANELLSSSFCGLEYVHTLAIPTVAILQHVLTIVLPSFIEEQTSKQGGRRIKLLVIDAIGELFHSNDKTTTSTLVERSKDIACLSARLHELASMYQLAIVVLNEVIDTFDRRRHNMGEQADLSYDYQSRWFNTAEFFGESKKEASLGLAWANQVNTRIMLTRTGRRKYLNDEDLPKRPRLNESPRNVEESSRQSAPGEQQPTLIRRLSVIFSNVCSPVSLDYTVMERGVSILQDRDARLIQISNRADAIVQASDVHTNEQSDDLASEALPLPLATVDAFVSLSNSEITESISIVDEFEDLLWSHADSYEDLDWDALEENLSQVQ
ncbi:P-loop containing nucleoside triphosphate hydrolase protein, partial [Flammula alnicola]